MKKLNIFLGIFLLLSLIISPIGWTITSYNCNGLTGGTQRDLDYLSVADLNNGDRGVVLTGTIFYFFKYDSTATDAEDTTTHPFKVRPDDYASAGVWIEQELASGAVDAAIIATDAVGSAEIIASGVDTAELATGAVIPAKVDIPGFVVRSKFTYKDGDEIYLDSAVYHHDGTTDQLVYWDSQLTFQFQNLGASDWSYLYLDDSAIVTLGSNLLTASEFVDSTTEPTWSASKHGWYNGEDRCIFSIFTSGGSAVLDFYHNGGQFVQYDAQIIDLSPTDIDDTFTDQALTIPNYGDDAQALVTLKGAYSVDGGDNVYWRKNGSSATVNIAGRVTATSVHSTNSLTVSVDSTQKIEIAMQTAGGSTIAVYTEGWYFPAGM
jgi:hypothetical protein